MALEPGMVLGGRYRVDERTHFTRDGGHLWRAVDLELGRSVEVKVFEQRLVASALALGREYRMISGIDHPGVVRVYGVSVEPAVCAYLVMEHVESRRITEDGAISPRRTLDLLAQIAEALQAVHDHGIVFRNLWKGLVMRTDGRFLLHDFHVAALVGDRALTGSATSCAPPEFPATTRSDIFDLGHLAYFCLTLTDPFRNHGGPTFDRRPWPPEVPSTVRDILDRCIVINPDHRWPSAAALAEAARGAS